METLYHVTLACYLDSIKRYGLEPGYGGKFGGGYAAHSHGKLFLTAADGVFFWHSRAEETQSPIEEEGQTPVVLKVYLSKRKQNSLHDDLIGTRDAMAASYFMTTAINPKQIDVWDGSEWVALSDVDIDGLYELIRSAATEDEDEYDGEVETFYWYDPDILFPLELHPGALR